MKISYDPVADAMYIYLSDKKKSTRTEEVGKDLIVDFSGEELVSIEILDASKKLAKKDLSHIHFITSKNQAKIYSITS